MILACGSLSSLACWQLLIIRGLARAFLVCGKVWGLEPHEQFRGLHVSARGSVNLFSTQLKLSRGRRNHASCSADDEGLFAGISMHPNPCTWLAFRATSRLTRTSRRLTLASVRLPVRSPLPDQMLFPVVCYQSLWGKDILWLKFTITASGTESKKEWVFGDCELNMRFMRIKTSSRANDSWEKSKHSKTMSVFLGNWKISCHFIIQNHRRGVGWCSKAYKLLTSYLRQKQSQRNNPFLFPASNMPLQL